MPVPPPKTALSSVNLHGSPLTLAIIGTDTGVGKTHVTTCLASGLRAQGRRVWLHKPMACGGWAEGQAEDARALRTMCADGQPPATVCPLQFPEPASPHVAAAAENSAVSLMQLLTGIKECRATSSDQHDLIVEGIGGLLVPLTNARETVADLLVAAQIPVLIVTRPHLGTLNHTALTVHVARARGLRVLGLVLNYHEAVADSLAVRSAATELPLLTGVPLLATLSYRPHTDDVGECDRLAAAVLAATVTN
jgi:dethiobiotin synthetase